MKRAKVNGAAVQGTGTQQEILLEASHEASVNEGRAHDDSSRRRMLENLKMALFFCQAQGRMARGER